MSMTALLTLVALLVIVAAIVFASSWALGWPGRSLRWAIIASVYASTLVVIGVAWFFGALTPIQSYIAQRKNLAFEQHLYLGESRSELEENFGRGIPNPDRIRGEAGDYYYEYISAEGMCFQEFRGFKVEYSIHGDYIVGWEPISDGDGC